MLIVAGDWNLRPSPVDAATWHILDKLAVGTRWANDDHLVNFALANRLVGYSTRFQHPQRQHVTRLSNDERTRNQIDHMLVRCLWVSSVIDCRASNGSQTGSKRGSDHAMVRASLRLRVSNPPAMLGTAKLKIVAVEHL